MSCHITILIVPEAEDGGKSERACDRLIMCIITTLNQGLRNGGGIGDVLRKPSSAVSVMCIYILCTRHQYLFLMYSKLVLGKMECTG